jgi:hypothetical protein
MENLSLIEDQLGDGMVKKQSCATVTYMGEYEMGCIFSLCCT